MQAFGLPRFLLTAETLRNADWPRESLDDVFYMPVYLPCRENREGRHLCGAGPEDSPYRYRRSRRIPRWKSAATLREHMRIPGMGLTTTRYFRDKLAMRMQALEHEIRVPISFPSSIMMTFATT